MRIKVLLAVFFLPFLVSGQNEKNPFEISGRMESLQDTMQTLALDKDTLEIDRPIETEIEQNQGINDEKNPFEVDHVPLRRKDLVKAEEKKIGEKNPSRSFLYWILIGSLILLVVATSSSKNLLMRTVRSVYNENILKFEFRSNRRFKIESILLYLIFFINGGLFLLLLAHHLTGVAVSAKHVLFAFAGILTLYFFRHLSYFLLGIFFPVEKESSLYNYSIQVFNSFLGIVLIPVNLVLEFGPDTAIKPTLYFGLSCISIILIIRYLRGLAISFQYIFNNIILFFIYLCTLEIAPVLVVIKLIKNFIN